MRSRPTGNSPQGWEQAHVDIGALAQRVVGLESAIGGIIESIRDISKKLDAKPTSVWIVLGSLGAAFTVVGGAIGFLLSPVNYTLDRHEREITHFAETAVDRDDYFRNRKEAAEALRDVKADLGSWSTNLRDRLRSDEDIAVNQRQITEIEKNADRLERRVDAIDAELVKRPEIEAADRTVNSRVDAMSARLNALTDQLNGLFPASEVIKELWSSLREIRNGKVGEAEK